MPIPSLQLQKKTCHMQRGRGSGHGVVISKKCYKWTIVEIELLASVSWTCGCQPFSCRCSQNVMHCRKEMCFTCLSKESIPAIHLWNSKHPTCQKLEVPESRSTFRHLCIKSWLHHAHPFVAAAEKDCVMQRSRGSGHGVVISKKCYTEGLKDRRNYTNFSNRRCKFSISPTRCSDRRYSCCKSSVSRGS